MPRQAKALQLNGGGPKKRARAEQVVDKKQRLNDIRVSIGKELLVLQNTNGPQELAEAIGRLQRACLVLDAPRPFTRVLDTLELKELKELAEAFHRSHNNAEFRVANMARCVFATVLGHVSMVETVLASVRSVINDIVTSVISSEFMNDVGRISWESVIATVGQKTEEKNREEMVGGAVPDGVGMGIAG